MEKRHLDYGITEAGITIYEANTFFNIIEFDKDRDIQMKRREFVRRQKLPELVFGDVLSLMKHFLSPVWEAIITEDEWLKSWYAESNTWNLWIREWSVQFKKIAGNIG